MTVRYLFIFFLFSSNLNSAEAESETFTNGNKIEKISAALKFQKFLMSKYEEKATRTEGDDDDHHHENSNWEDLQHQRMEDVVEEVNSMFEPLQVIFILWGIGGYQPEARKNKDFLVEYKYNILCRTTSTTSC